MTDTAAKTAPKAADTTEKTKNPNTTVTASLTPKEYQDFQDVRFSERHNKVSDAVKAALVEYIANHKQS